MLLNSREIKFLKNYRNVYGKSSAKDDYRDENLFVKEENVQAKRADFLNYFYL